MEAEVVVVEAEATGATGWVVWAVAVVVAVVAAWRGEATAAAATVVEVRVETARVMVARWW